MSKKARFCRALLVLLGFGTLTASKCDGPVDMYGPAPMYGPLPTDSEVHVMYGVKPSTYDAGNAVSDQAALEENNVKE